MIEFYFQLQFREKKLLNHFTGTITIWQQNIFKLCSSGTRSSWGYLIKLWYVMIPKIANEIMFYAIHPVKSCQIGWKRRFQNWQIFKWHNSHLVKPSKTLKLIGILTFRKKLHIRNCFPNLSWKSGLIWLKNELNINLINFLIFHKI